MIPRARARAGADDDERNALVSHLDRMRVPELGGADRRSTPAASAVRRRCFRAADCSQWRPAVGPWMTHNSCPTGSVVLTSSHGWSCCQPQRSIPTSRRRPPYLCAQEQRRDLDPDGSARASLRRYESRSPRTTISARSRAPSARSSAARITATISSIVGGQPGTAGLYSSAAVPGGNPAWWLAIGDARPRLTERIPSRPPQDVETGSVDRGRQATPSRP